MEDRQQLEHEPVSLPEDPLFTPEDLEPRAFTPPPRHRVLWTLAILIVLVLLAVLPPLVHVNGYQKQISASISQSLGRPVHAGEITLNLLPFPGFTIQNFVVSEDPSFGSEPVIRASSVLARLRWRSLWHRRVEFSRITLSDASVNLVRRPGDGQWNLESILLQASRMPAAPTGQRGAGDRPRFPYIEATGARLNLKMGLEKLPVSLTEADFALWLPQAEQWHLRLEAHPARTDASVTDTGTLRLEGTLGRAASLAQVPIDLRGSWTAAPLGAASSIASGRDMGFRGELNLNATLKGTVGDNALATRLQLDRVRRADFVPARLMEADITCTARALANLHRLEDLHCAWPTGSTASGLTVTGRLPDTLAPGSAEVQATLQGVPASGLLDLLRLASARVSPALNLDGTIAAHVTCCTAQAIITSGDFAVAHAALSSGAQTFLAGDLAGTWTDGQMVFQPVDVSLGDVKPAQLAAQVGLNGYRLQLTGPAKRESLDALAAALPQFGDGLAAILPATPELSMNLTSTRIWPAPPVWTAPQPSTTPSPRRKPRRR